MMVKKPPLVSAIIPYLNTPEAILREAIDSVIAQSYRPLEIALVDDGSEPALTESLINTYSTLDLPVRWLQHGYGVNRGVSASRNLGISMTSGDYVAFLDADDVWLPNKLERQVSLMEAHRDVALLFGQTLYWHINSLAENDSKANTVPWRAGRTLRKYTAPDYLVQMLRGRTTVPAMSNSIIRRKALEHSGAFEDEFDGLYEDQVMLAKICLRNTVCSVPELWDKYRQHSGSMTMSAPHLETMLARRRFLFWLQKYCQQHGFTHKDIWEAIAKGLWMNDADCQHADDPGYSLHRWTVKWQLRIEEAIIPAGLRQRRWNRTLADQLKSTGVESTEFNFPKR